MAQFALGEEYQAQGDKAHALIWYVQSCAGRGGDGYCTQAENKIPMFTKDMSFLRKAADGGDPEALFIFGIVNQYGFHVMINEANAILWYQVAAKAGYRVSQEQLAAINAKGGPERDPLCHQLLQRAREEQRYGGPAATN